MINPWRSEIPLLAIALLVGIFIGKVFQHPLIVLLGMVLLYLGYHLYHIRCLFNWIRSGKTSELPQGLGIWEEIYLSLIHI